MFTRNKEVTLVYKKAEQVYCSIKPYHPNCKYPEYPFDQIGVIPNPAYDMLRMLFHQSGFDKSHFDSPFWNPLGEFIKPGNRVVIKPNLVSHYNYGYWNGNNDLDSLVTHGSLIRAVLDYVYIALKGKGEILIGDCPLQGTDWEKVVELTGLLELKEFLETDDLKIKIKDYRLVVARMEKNRIVEQYQQNDIKNYTEVDLGKESLLMPIIDQHDRFGISAYGQERMKQAHNPQKNAYLIPNEFLGADIFLNLPKLKTHMKAGITCSLKNLIGINGHKDYLPHFRLGGSKVGGDEYPHRYFLEPLYYNISHREWKAKSIFKKLFYYNLGRVVGKLLPRGFSDEGQGGWSGNDTLWRTILDINRAFFYYDISESELSAPSRRKYLSIIDGIIGGQNEGPLSPTRKVANCLIMGVNPVATDVIASVFMGFNPEKIKQLLGAFERMRFPLTEFNMDDITIIYKNQKLDFSSFYNSNIKEYFEPSKGWRTITID